MREVKERLLDVIEAIEILEKSIPISKRLHELDEIVFLGIVRCIEIIGESCRTLPESFKDKYANIPWNKIIGMRHVLVHQYFNVDVEKVEEAINFDIPILKEKILNVLKDIT